MRRPKLLLEAIIGTLIATPIVIAKINYEPPVTIIEGEKVYNVETASELYEEETTTEEPSVSYETVVEEIVLETAPAFTGYDFIPLDQEVQTEVYNFCEANQISYDLIMAMVKTESDFVWTTGDYGYSVGYMQVQEQWWGDLINQLGFDVYEPAQNIECGVAILLYLLNENNGDLKKAITAYNTGIPNGNETYYNRVTENLNWVTTAREAE